MPEDRNTDPDREQDSYREDTSPEQDQRRGEPEEPAFTASGVVHRLARWLRRRW